MSDVPVLRRFVRLPSENEQAEDFVEFEFRSKRWRLLRRTKGGVRGTVYYVKFEVGGRAVFQSTGEEKKGRAIEVAKLKIAAALDGRWDALRESKLREVKPVTDLEEILQAYEGRVSREGKRVGGILSSVEALNMRAETPRRNANAVRVVVRRALGLVSLRGVSGAVLARPGLVADFVSAHVASAGTDKVARDSRIRGARSTVIQARSVFSQAALAHCYGGVVLPELGAFLKGALPAGKLPPKEGLSTEDIWEMGQAASQLSTTPDPYAQALYLVHLLFRHLGLRNDEIEQARVEWFAPVGPSTTTAIYLRNGEKREIAGVVRVVTRSYWEPKQSGGEVPIAPCVWRELARFLSGRGPLEHVVLPEAGKTERAELVDRVHGDFVRPWTSKLRKKGYELRRWGQTLVKRREGDEMASRFVRHAEKTTGGRYYDTEAVWPAPITLGDCGVDS